MKRIIAATVAAMTLGTAIGVAVAQSGLLGEPVRFPDASPAALEADGYARTEANSIASDINYATRRGWFTGKADGTFDPHGQLTSQQLVRVVERAFPQGMTRAAFATMLGEGEWAAGLTPGRFHNYPLPQGTFWQVGDWDFRVVNAWPQDGYQELVRRDSRFGEWHNVPTGKQYTLIDVEVIYRGNANSATFDLKTYPKSANKFYNPGSYAFNADSCSIHISRPPGYLGESATGVRPGATVRGWLCYATDAGDAPTAVIFTDDSLGSAARAWAWISLVE